SQASVSVLTDLVVDRPVDDALAKLDAFVELMQGRGKVEPDEDVLEDGVAFAGVAKYPARVKCALLGWMAVKAALVQAGVEKAREGAEISGPRTRPARAEPRPTCRSSPRPTRARWPRSRTWRRRCATWSTPSWGSTSSISAWCTTSGSARTTSPPST